MRGTSKCLLIKLEEKEEQKTDKENQCSNNPKI